MRLNESIFFQELKKELPFMTDQMLDKISFTITVEQQERQKAIEEIDAVVQQEHEDAIKLLAEKIDQGSNSNGNIEL